jgi:hypothetical protein
MALKAGHTTELRNYVYVVVALPFTGWPWPILMRPCSLTCCHGPTKLAIAMRFLSCEPLLLSWPYQIGRSLESKPKKLIKIVVAFTGRFVATCLVVMAFYRLAIVMLLRCPFAVLLSWPPGRCSTY